MLFRSQATVLGGMAPRVSRGHRSRHGFYMAMATSDRPWEQIDLEKPCRSPQRIPRNLDSGTKIGLATCLGTLVPMWPQEVVRDSNPRPLGTKSRVLDHSAPRGHSPGESAPRVIIPLGNHPPGESSPWGIIPLGNHSPGETIPLGNHPPGESPPGESPPWEIQEKQALHW